VPYQLNQVTKKQSHLGAGLNQFHQLNIFSMIMEVLIGDIVNYLKVVMILKFLIRFMSLLQQLKDLVL